MMRAWQVDRIGEPSEVLRLGEAKIPEPGPGQLRIRVHTAALNFSDDLVCRGRYQVKPELPFTPGMEATGVVDATGGPPEAEIPGLPAWKPGDRVMATMTLPRGALAEYAIAEAQNTYRATESVNNAQAAGLLIPYQTTHVALHHRAALRSGETLLVHAGAGGMGSAAIQLGVAAGARVIATAGGPEKVALCRELGAEIAIDYRADDFVAIVNDETSREGANVIFDPVGGDTFDRSRKCIAWEGRILIIGFAGGRIADLPTNHALVKNYSVIGIYMGQYSRRARPFLDEIHAELLRLLDTGQIDPMIHLEVPLEDAAKAIGALASGKTTGKVIVHVET